MPLHFTTEELAGRRARAIEAMRRQGLDGLLMFRQESMYYLTGYDTFGFVFFQCLAMSADGRLTLLTRSPDLRQARYTSMIEDIRIWKDGPDADPARTDLKPILEEHGLKGKRLGVEWEAYGLTARNGRRLESAMEGFARLEDASELVTRLRAVKSRAELAFVRRAAELADDALNEAYRLARPGAFEGDILAAMQGAVFKGDGDYSGNVFIIGSGPQAAFLGRYHAGRRVLGEDDQLTLEFAGAYRHYHSALMTTIKIGKSSEKHRAMFQLGLDAAAAARAALKPGRPVGDAYAAYADAVTKGGYGRAGANPALYFSLGYGLGTTFAPNWMDWPMLHQGNPIPAEAGMVFFMHSGVRDDQAGLAALPGETCVVTEKGGELVSKPMKYVLKD
ncbi:MAG: aminopeptidase P family protein [Rhodospirillales bacterium]|nr:aminopeptidase P family protein [Rhodospirillales bacterium]